MRSLIPANGANLGSRGKLSEPTSLSHKKSSWSRLMSIVMGASATKGKGSPKAEKYLKTWATQLNLHPAGTWHMHWPALTSAGTFQLFQRPVSQIWTLELATGTAQALGHPAVLQFILLQSAGNITHMQFPQRVEPHCFRTCLFDHAVCLKRPLTGQRSQALLMRGLLGALFMQAAAVLSFVVCLYQSIPIHRN